MEKLFNRKVHLYETHNCIRATLYSKEVFDYLRKIHGFPVGKKGHVVVPPNTITTRECKIRLLRGLFDTDGSIHLQRKKYPVIAITTTSEPLAYKVQDLLNELDFGAYICKSKSEHKLAYRVTIFGRKKILRWKEIIGSSNPYHLKRIISALKINTL